MGANLNTMKFKPYMIMDLGFGAWLANLSAYAHSIFELPNWPISKNVKLFDINIKFSNALQLFYSSKNLWLTQAASGVLIGVPFAGAKIIFTQYTCIVSLVRLINKYIYYSGL